MLIIKKNPLITFLNQYIYKLSLAALGLKLFAIPIGLITALLLANIVSNATSGKANYVLYNSIILLSVALGITILNIITSTIFEKHKKVMVHKCKLAFYKQLLSRKLYKLYGLQHGTLIENLNDDFNTITNSYLSLKPELCAGIITTAVYIIFLMNQGVIPALCLLVLSLLQIIPPIIIKRYMQINYDQTRNIEAEITDFIINGYNGFTTIKLYKLKKWYMGKLELINKKYFKIGIISEVTSTSENSMSELFSYILKYGSYTIGGLLVLWKLSTLEVVIQMLALSESFYGAVRTIFNTIPKFGVVSNANSRLMPWFYDDVDKNDKSLCETSNKIELRNVFYSYNEKQILNNINIDFSTNNITIIRGDNGIGKSTLFKLITGLVRSQSGDVTIKGLPSNKLSDDKLAKILFYLPQEDANFDFTPNELFEMINKKHIEKCKKTAIEFGLAEKLLSEFKIAELSGGERKKVFLSLAFSLDNDILLLLDEPTNSLDTYGKTALKVLMQNRKVGIIVITHDDYLFDISDVVYIMQGDVVNEQ